MHARIGVVLEFLQFQLLCTVKEAFLYSLQSDIFLLVYTFSKAEAESSYFRLFSLES